MIKFECIFKRTKLFQRWGSVINSCGEDRFDSKQIHNEFFLLDGFDFENVFLLLAHASEF